MLILLWQKREKVFYLFSWVFKNLNNDIKIIDAKVGTFTKKPFYQLEDNYKNKYNLYVMSMTDYQLLRNGTLDGQDNELFDEDNVDSLDVELIKVATRSGETKFIPKGSTVLDFAFKIHKDIGFGFKYAIVNNSKNQIPSLYQTIRRW